MKIITWNINSVRLRLPLLEEIANTYSPDVICLQETKAKNEDFPLDGVKNIGFPYVAFEGIPSYNGVAILSKFPISNIRVKNWVGKKDARHIIATIKGVDIHSLYIPAGGDEPDPEINIKFAHKLAFIDDISEYLEINKASNSLENDKNIICGDFNIAPLENDVWSHKQLLKVVCHTPIEIMRLERFYKSLDWVDAVRKFIPASQKLYSWWSYRARDWKKSNRGRRLDHVWVTPNLENNLVSARVLEDVRSAEKPSDHAPVEIEIDL
jgi:exodeoxyribonuclease-3